MFFNISFSFNTIKFFKNFFVTSIIFVVINKNERPDVKEYRKEFVKLIDIKKKDFGYLQKMNENKQTFLEKSIVRIEGQKKTVLFCDYESTFRMSETPSHRWAWNKEYGLFNKGTFIG